MCFRDTLFIICQKLQFVRNLEQHSAVCVFLSISCYKNATKLSTLAKMGHVFFSSSPKREIRMANKKKSLPALRMRGVNENCWVCQCCCSGSHRKNPCLCEKESIWDDHRHSCAKSRTHCCCWLVASCHWQPVMQQQHPPFKAPLAAGGS